MTPNVSFIVQNKSLCEDGIGRIVTIQVLNYTPKVINDYASTVWLYLKVIEYIKGDSENQKYISFNDITALQSALRLEYGSNFSNQKHVYSSAVRGTKNLKSFLSSNNLDLHARNIKT